jgi:hypothetical protein
MLDYCRARMICRNCFFERRLASCNPLERFVLSHFRDAKHPRFAGKCSKHSDPFTVLQFRVDPAPPKA